MPLHNLCCATDPSMSSEFYVNHHHHHHHHHNNNHNHNDESTTTSLSISSTTSSNKTSDENASRSTSRKASTSPTDTINPFEKYRYAMQKEIESLQTKTRKMDSTIQTLETEKNDTKALLLDRDLELADLRSKNALLQKTASIIFANKKELWIVTSLLIDSASRKVIKKCAVAEKD